MKKKAHSILMITGLLLTIVAFRAGHVLVDQVQVRLFSHLKISVMQVYTPVAGYKLMGDGEPVTQLLAGINYRFTQEGDKIQVLENQKLLGTFSYIRLIGNGNSELRIRLLQPDRKVRTYADNISMGVNDGGIRIIN